MNAHATSLCASPATRISVSATDFDENDALTRRLDAEGADEITWEAWDKRFQALLAAVEALPVTAGNAVIKARAVMSIVLGDPNDLGDESTCGRLSRQVVASLGAAIRDETEWARLVNAYRAALLAERAYDAEHIDPFFSVDKTADGLAGINIAVWEEAERLQDIRCNIEDPLMTHPAPDANGFALKYLIARGDGRQADGWDDLLEAESKRFAYLPSVPSATFETLVTRYREALACHDAACARASKIEEVLFERQPPTPVRRKSRTFTLDGVEHTIESVLWESDIDWVAKEHPDVADELRVLVAGHKAAIAALEHEIGMDRAEEEREAASDSLDAAYEELMGFAVVDVGQLARKIEIADQMYDGCGRDDLARILVDARRLAGAA